jgi:mRNA interferase RelE/StbE
MKKREIRFHKDAEKFLNKTDQNTFNRLVSAIEKLALIPPEGDIKTLQGYENCFRARVGKFRIVYKLSGDAILIRDIDSSVQIYKGGF